MMKVVGIFVHLKIQSMLIIIKQNDTRFGTTHSVYQFWMIKKSWMYPQCTFCSQTYHNIFKVKILKIKDIS